MNIAGEELSRIVKETSHDNVFFIDRSPEPETPLKKCGSDRGQHRNFDDSMKRRRLLDKIRTNLHGDSSLHRLVSTHAPVDIVEDFLTELNEYDQLEGTQGIKRARSTDSTCWAACGLGGSHPQVDHQNEKGVTVLHIALYRNSWHVEKIVELLLTASKMHLSNSGQSKTGLASIPMEGGSYPLHIWCGHSLTIRTRVISSLVEADPDVVVKADIHGDNPLSLLWKNVLRFRWATCIEQGKKNVDCIDGDDSWMTVISPQQFMQYSLIMIRGHHVSNTESKDNVSLHTICAMPNCPPLLLRLAMIPKYKQMFRVCGDVGLLDEHGMLPLHHAASKPAVNSKFLPAQLQENGIKNVIELLLDAYPEGARVVDIFGRLPLHYALENQCIQVEAILALVRVFPESLRFRDPNSNLYPFVQAAVTTNSADWGGTTTRFDDDESNVCISYRLLRQCPDVVQL